MLCVFWVLGTPSFWIVRHWYANGALSVCILRPHYLECFGCLFLEVFRIYAAPVVFAFSFSRECLCVLHLLDENNICHLKKK